MTFAVVVVEKPDPFAQPGQSGWHGFARYADGQDPRVGTDLRPSENCWLLPLPSESHTLARIVHLAQEHGLAHRVLYLEGQPAVYTWQPPKQ